MSALQHSGARELLEVISRAYPRGKTLTYASAAELIGRPRDHARAVAQMCDLLDAAAAYARSPLLALVAIRSNNGEINPKAWKKEVSPERRQRIIAHSLAYEFGMRDYDAIGRALDSLTGLSNLEAWRFVRAHVPDRELFAVIAGNATHAQERADPVADHEFEAIEGDRRLISHLRRERNPALVRKKKNVSLAANGGLICESCGSNSRNEYPGLPNDPWEVHHRLPLGRTGERTVTTLRDLAILCPNCHRAIHRTRPMLSVEEFRIKYKVAGRRHPT